MKVSLITLGCRVNQSESSVIEGTLKENGVTIVGLKENPDFCIVNSCTVTSESDRNSRQMIRRAVRSGAEVIVTGCYAHLRPEEVKAISGVSKVVDNNSKYNIVNLITDKSTDLFFGNYSRSRPYLKVQDGCNFRCSYCSVPFARGRSRSIPVDEVIKRAEIIESRGYNEIVLTGIHLGTYGDDLAEKTNLNSLLKRILRETKIFRIRLSSLEINELDDELIELMQEDRVCKHLHLPLQSGSNKILKLMRRNYTREYFRKNIETVLSRVDNISIGTDVIVGFPEEGEEEFRDTYTLLNELPLSYLHIFPFSVRTETRASKMVNRPSHADVKSRIAKIRELNSLKKREYMSRQLYKRLDIIIEEKLEDNTIVGTSNNYMKISVTSNKHSRGSLVFVRPTRVMDEMLEGIVIL